MSKVAELLLLEIHILYINDSVSFVRGRQFNI